MRSPVGTVAQLLEQPTLLVPTLMVSFGGRVRALTGAHFGPEAFRVLVAIPYHVQNFHHHDGP
jgi:hypothetical protein